MEVLDIVILLFIGLGIFAGYRKGLFNQAGSLLGLLVGLYLATKYYSDLVQEIYPAFLDSESVASIISFIVIWLLSSMVLSFIGSLLTQFFDAIYLGVFNRLLGGLFGGLRSAVLLSFFIYVFNTMDTDNKWLSEGTKVESLFYQPMQEVGGLLFFTIKGAYLSIKV